MLHAAWLHEQVSITTFHFDFPFPLDASSSDMLQQSRADDKCCVFTCLMVNWRCLVSVMQ